jgi:hypothetical protein
MLKYVDVFIFIEYPTFSLSPDQFSPWAPNKQENFEGSSHRLSEWSPSHRGVGLGPFGAHLRATTSDAPAVNLLSDQRYQR